MKFAWSDLAKTGLSTKDFIAPTSFTFSKDGKTFRIGEYSGAVSFLQILAPELTDRMLAEFLDLDDAVTINLHIQSYRPGPGDPQYQAENERFAENEDRGTEKGGAGRI